MEQLTLAIKFTAKPEHAETFKQILTELFQTISREKNFVNATLHQGLQNPGEFYVYETWNDQLESFLSVQMKSAYAVAFKQQLELLEVTRAPMAFTPFAYYGTHNIK